MENPATEFFQLTENAVISNNSVTGISSYISCIRINGRPILPPLITEEKRKELSSYKKKAIEIECRLAENKQRNAILVKSYSIVDSEISGTDEPSHKQSTPARPVMLQLIPNISNRTFVLPSTSDSKVNRTNSDGKEDINSNVSSDTISSQKSTNKLKNKLYRSTLEQRLANEDTVSVENRKNVYEQSPIVEENYPLALNESVDSEHSKNSRNSWSPLKIDAINSLRIEMSSKDTQAAEKLSASVEDLENSSETLTASPSLMRQNSYTLLAPSPALLQFLETQKEDSMNKRPQSRRKTWDLTKAKRNWSPGVSECLDKSLDDDLNDDRAGERNRESSSSLDGFPLFQMSFPRNSSPNELLPYTDDGSTSPSSYSFKGNSPKFQKIKCKIKTRRVRPHKNVPSPKSSEKVPNFGSNSTQGPSTVFVPSHVKEELTDLSNLLNRMKQEHERQKKELEEKQKTEMNKLESLFKQRESELLRRIVQESPVYPKSIYSQYSNPHSSSAFPVQVMGDGKHNLEKCPLNERSLALEENLKRPQSAKDYYGQSGTDNESRRTKSMDFNQAAASQDTDGDFSFHESLQSKEIYTGNDDMIETDTISNFSSHSSTLSSDTKLESMPLLDMKKNKIFELTSEEFEKYNQAAAVITAAARGFLTRRLLRTAHVQGLITTLRDAISCATQLHGASDLGESDVDLMKRLGRQIEAAWEAVYAVFFDTDTLAKMQLISADRERLRSISSKLSSAEPKRRISSATMKSLRRKSGCDFGLSKSQMANGSSKTRKIRPRMIASYPCPSVHYKLK